MSADVEVPMVARLRRHDRTADKLVPVPPGQSLDFDPGEGAYRRWLWPYLGTEWHLVEFEPAEKAPEGHSE